MRPMGILKFVPIRVLMAVAIGEIAGVAESKKVARH